MCMCECACTNVMHKNLETKNAIFPIIHKGMMHRLLKIPSRNQNVYILCVHRACAPIFQQKQILTGNYAPTIRARVRAYITKGIMFLFSPFFIQVRPNLS